MNVLDHVHIGVTAALWIAGLIYICLTLPKVSPIRRVSYVLAIPLWLVGSVLYVVAFFDAPPPTPLTGTAIALRALLFGIALEGLFVPFTDRLELKHRPQEIRIRP